MAEEESNDYRIALAGTLPGEQANGWDGQAEDLDADRARVRYALVAYNVASLKEVTATGKKVLTVQLLRIEPCSDEEDEGLVSTMLRERFEARTGQTTLFADGAPPAGDPDDWGAE